MKKINQGLFLFKLILLIIGDLLSFLLFKHRRLLYPVLVLVLAIFLSLNSFFIPKPSSSNLDQIAVFNLTKKQILQQKNTYESALLFQPKHRDILYNLYLLEKASSNINNAENYYRLAKNLDPNHPF